MGTFRKTVGIIGYGNTGKSFAQRISASRSKPFVMIFWTMLGINLLGKSVGKSCNLSAKSSASIFLKPHRPRDMIDKKFIADMTHPFWLLNTARGSALVTDDLVAGLKSKKVLGAGLDVLEYETRSFSSIFNEKVSPSTSIFDEGRQCNTQSPCGRLDPGESCQTGHHHCGKSEKTIFLGLLLTTN